MRCEHCNIVIGAEFTHAIKNNQCPACGQPIMQKSKLAAFLSLRTLLDDQITAKGVDVDRLTSVIMANFDVRQIFEKVKDAPSKVDADRGIIESETEMVEEDDSDPDAEYKERQKEEAKAILKRMRDEVLEGAVKERYGLGGEDSLILNDGEEVDPFEYAQKMEQEQKRDMILSGAGGKGSFSRSDG